MNEKQLLGSQTAKNGFKNEDDIVNKFNNWQTDTEAQLWLSIMGYDLCEIKGVTAVKIARQKTDVQAQVTVRSSDIIEAQNMQVKLVSNPKGFNQIDKRWINHYDDLWHIPADIKTLLKLYTGEHAPTINNPKDKRRMFVNEFNTQEREKLIKWLGDNQTMIISDILKGRGILAAEWMLVAQSIGNSSRWILKPMNFCINYFGNGEVQVTQQGNIKLGKITMQRKGGDGGRDTAKMLQFKINPAELFDSED